jgi:hypothetical protein
MVRSYCPLCQIVIPPTLIDGHAQAWPRHRLVRVAEPSPETLALLDATFDQPIGTRALSERMPTPSAEARSCPPSGARRS